MAAAGRMMPTLSQVRAWDVAHLTDAAGHWSRVATVWEDTFTELAARIGSPGGALWEGEAAESAQLLARSDRMAVLALADQLHCASGIARSGASELDEARRLVLRVVDTAEDAGFTVGDDFSVADPNYYDSVTAALRQAQAEALAADLRATIGTLLTTDATVAGQLTTATAGLDALVFPETASSSAAESTGGTVQLVSSFKRDGGPIPTPVPAPEFRQCVEGEFRKNAGFNAVKDGFKSAVTGAVAGAAGGGSVLPKGSKPIGALGGGVIGFVGGFTKGVATSPVKTLVEAAADCSNIIEELKP